MKNDNVKQKTQQFDNDNYFADSKFNKHNLHQLKMTSTSRGSWKTFIAHLAVAKGCV